VNKFAHQRFEPMGMTTNSDIPFAKSLVDYIFRWLGMQFIHGYREQNAPRRSKSGESALHSDHTAGAGGAPGFQVKKPVKEDAPWAGRSLASSSQLDSDATDDPSSEPSAQHLSAEAKGGASALPGDRLLSDVAAGSMLDDSDGAPKRPSSRMRIVVAVEAETRAAGNVLDQSNAQLMGDAPACDVCGSITVRNGTCYRCMNCGQSMGCS
ncbi:MAG: hypothetical protein JNK53_00690, partial [Phycisphaerae bacterium]|nr:hypothetical protein [Phycisphaerae bacterium]